MVERLYPVTETLFHPFNLLYMFAIGGVALAAVALLHPRRDPVTFTPEQLDRILPRPPEPAGSGGSGTSSRRPGCSTAAS